MVSHGYSQSVKVLVVVRGGDALYACGVVFGHIGSGEHDQDSTASVLEAPGDRRTAVRHAQQERKGPSTSEQKQTSSGAKGALL